MSSRAARPLLVSLMCVWICACWIPAMRAQGATATAAWQDFGSVAVGSASGSTTIAFAVPSGVAAPTLRMAYGVDFHGVSAVCSGGTCSVGVVFEPHVPGLHEDSVQALDAQGNLLAWTNVKGIGLAPELAVLPAALSTFAGDGAWGRGGDGGQATAAALGNPQGVAVDAAGGVYVADSLEDTIRYISPGGVISTVAGTGAPGFAGDGGAAISAELDDPSGIALDAAGNLFIADAGNNRIRRVDAVSHIITTVAGNGTAAFSGDGGAAVSASLYGPAAVAVDPAGNLYVADTYNNRIREVSTAGVISTVVGGGTTSLAGTTSVLAGSSVALVAPAGVAIGATGNVYLADTGNHIIAKWTTAGVVVVAGTGTPGFSGDGGAATAAELQAPSGLAADSAGDLFIADSNNSVIRLVAAGQIQTIAGNPGQLGFGGDGGSAALSVLNDPAGIALDASGKLYVADQGNRRVRMLDFAGSLLAFATTDTGVISATQALTALNIGNQALSMTAMNVSANFVEQASGRTDCAAGLIVQPGTGCFADIAFAPAAAGSWAGSVQIVDNTNNVSTQHAVPLAGVAVTGAAPNVSITPGTTTFASQPLGTVSSPQSITISNSGSGALAVGALALSGTNTSDFQISSNCGSSVASGSSCTVSVTFVPHGLGTRSATLMVNDDAVGSPQRIVLTGTGASALAWVGAVPISVYGTGQTGNGTLAAEGSVDAHWTILNAADWVHPGPRAYVVTSASLPSGWAANGPNSDWIAPTATGSTVLASGPYVYRTSFDLTGLDASTATLSGTIAAAGSATALLNGVPVGGFGATGSATQTGFSIESGFVSGTNTFDIVITNATAGPTGVRVEISGSAQRIAAAPIAVFGTGVTKSGTLASTGTVDANYVLESSADPSSAGPSAYVISAESGWTADGPYSNWISPSSEAGATLAAGTYVYRTSFDLTGLNASTAILIGHLTSVGSATVKLNGAAVANVSASGSAASAPFIINGGFVSGVNVLEFSVTSTTAGSTGLRVDLTGSAQPAGPDSIALWGTGTGPSGLTADGSADAHYFLETGGLLAAPGPAAYVIPTSVLPSGWVADGPGSKWISPAQTGKTQFPAGVYTYRTSFDLTGLNVASAVINGELAASGSVTAFLNGIAVPDMPVATASSLQPFTITSGFVSGVNVLEFSIATSAANLLGLRVDLSGSAQSEFGAGADSLSATAISFAPQKTGTSSTGQSVTITNAGTTALQILGIVPNGPDASDFKVSTTCGATVAVDATCSITATFSPIAAGIRSAFLALTDTAGDSPETLLLEGVGRSSPEAPVHAQRPRSIQVSRGQVGR